MSVPPIIIQHGEKAAVALVLILAAYGVYATYRDDSTLTPRPTPQVDQEFQLINQAIQNPGTPNLREAPDVASHIRTRFNVAGDLEVPTLIAFLHEVWSLGQTTDLEYPPFLYGFEVRQPELQAQDLVGSMRLNIRLPEARRPANHPRLRDGYQRMSVQRAISPRESYTNTAEVVGVQVQRRVAGGQWEPLRQAGNDMGFVPLERAARPVTVDDVSEWQTYEFRARLLAVATGPEEDGRPTLGREVLVFAGESPLPPEQERWKELDELAYQGVPLSVQTADRLHSAGRQQVQALLTRALSSSEQVYLGGWSEIAAEQVSSTTRFALIRVSPPVQEGEPPRVQFGLTRKRSDRWIPVQRMTVDVGDRLGDAEWPITDPESNLRVPVDLSTPFKLVEVDLEAERITHYEIRNTSDGAGQRVLDINPRVNRAARTATLENVNTGQRLTLVQLSRVVVRPTSDIVTNYPAREPGAINELERFEADPMGFRQPRLKVPEPVWREPDDRTLWEHFPNAPSTETRYLDLPDGRFLVIDQLNDRIIRTFVRPGSAYERNLLEAAEDEDEDENE